MASKFEWTAAAATVLVGLMGCAPRGLPPVPPGEDPSVHSAPIPEVPEPADPFSVSAFEGEPVEAKSDGHHGHHQHGVEAPVQSDPTEEHHHHHGGEGPK